MAGLPKKYAKMGFKEGWKAFKTSKKKSNPKSNPKPKKKKVKSMAKRKRRSRKLTIPLAPIIGIIATPAISNVIPALLRGDIYDALKWSKNLVGIWGDGSFHAETLVANMTPIIAGLLIHKFVGGAPLNLNKMLAQANVPLLRI